jgi:hypothetical protein
MRACGSTALRLTTVSFEIGQRVVPPGADRQRRGVVQGIIRASTTTTSYVSTGIDRSTATPSEGCGQSSRSSPIGPRLAKDPRQATLRPAST